MDTIKLREIILQSYISNGINVNDALEIITLYAKEVLELDTSKINFEPGNPFHQNNLSRCFDVARKYYDKQLTLVRVYDKNNVLKMVF